MSPLAQLLEAALFAASRPLTLDELATLDAEAGEVGTRAALAELRAAWAGKGDHGVELVEIGAPSSRIASRWAAWKWTRSAAWTPRP